jgi:Asp-tRNA(Asn)/Glu-tRNA(Gln) amidotransferase C subunit
MVSISSKNFQRVLNHNKWQSSENISQSFDDYLKTVLDKADQFEKIQSKLVSYDWSNIRLSYLKPRRMHGSY